MQVSINDLLGVVTMNIISNLPEITDDHNWLVIFCNFAKKIKSLK